MSDRLPKLKNPVVLIHGLGAKATLGPIDYFYGLGKRLTEAKIPFIIPNLSSWNSIEKRTENLQAEIIKAFPDQKVNLMGHSLGGIDSRFLASCPDFGERVASVTTIGSPNHGTAIADVLMKKIPAPVLFAIDNLLSRAGMSNEGFRQTTKSYNEEVLKETMKDNPDVGYYSATSYIPDPVRKNSLPVFWYPHKVIFEQEGDNDGMVSVESAKYGEFICNFPGDHYAQIGHPFGRSKTLNYIEFYSRIFKRLHKDGF